jgi:hypothetical protein
LINEHENLRRDFGPTLPDAPTPATNRTIVTVLAGKRTVEHSRSRIRSAIAHRLNTRVGPTEIDRHQGAANPSG